MDTPPPHPQVPTEHLPQPGKITHFRLRLWGLNLDAVLPFKADWENSWSLRRLSEEGEHSLILMWLTLNETSSSSSCGTFFIASPQISMQICPLVLWT